VNLRAAVTKCKERMGLPLLCSNTDKKKENHAERAQRELWEDQLAEATYDHVYWFQQRSAHYDIQVKEPMDRVEPDAVDQDELDELEREVLGFEDDNVSSESDSDVGSKSKSQRKSEKNKGRFFRYYLF
jgi:hypothetical protein